MQAVCSAGLLASPGRAAAHPGDIAWLAGWRPKPVGRLAEMFLLWEEGSQVVGFAAFQPDDGGLSVFVSPGLANTEAAVDFEDSAQAWASRGDAAVRWFELENETAAIERWRDRGYRPAGESYLNLTRALDDLVGEVGADDRIRPVGGDDVQDRASITHAAFDGSEPIAAYAAAYAAFRASPAYPHGWDLLLRDADPGYVEALMAPDAMTIPANTEGGAETRAAQAGAVFSLDPETGRLHMRYTARTRSIVWKDDERTRAAVAALDALLAAGGAHVFRYRLASGEGLLCNNVLHNREAFEDAPGATRLLYRARYYDRVAGTGLNERI